MNKPYTLASERAAAPTSEAAYIAPMLTYMWFRWDGIRDSGYNRTGAEAAAESGSKPVQVFADGEWHPVAAYGTTCAQSAAIYFSKEESA